MKIAVFISPHGFGHAARASAVMEALGRRREVSFHLFTRVAPVFFDDISSAPVHYHPLESDVGLRQHSALEADPQGTVEALAAFRSRVSEMVQEASRIVEAEGCHLTLSDISPLGILVAEACGIPSVLMENFTWDWIYGSLTAGAPGLEAHRRWFESVYGRAGHRFQVEPICRPHPGASTFPPVAREPRRSPQAVRAALGIGMEERVILVTMGGIPQDLPFLPALAEKEGHFLITGWSGGGAQGNIHFFPRNKPVYSPDLMAAADLVVTKLGYSTVAEVWRQDKPLLFVANDAFGEVAVLRRFVEGELRCREVEMDTFLSGRWLAPEWAGALMGAGGNGAGAGPMKGKGDGEGGGRGDADARPNGADEVAEALVGLVAGRQTPAEDPNTVTKDPGA